MPLLTSYAGTLIKTTMKTVLLPLLILGLMFYLCYQLKLDFVVADWLYQLQGSRWVLQQHWLMQTILHDRVRDLNLMVVVALSCYGVWLCFAGQSAVLRRAVATLLCSVLSCFAVVSLLKHVLPMECPWDLQQFGGDLPFYGLLEPRPEGTPIHLCFPAGHASIGFAWLGLYYFFLDVKPQWASNALIGAAVTGLLLGAVQQSRGAHFFSHDIATAAICWALCSVIYYSRRQKLSFDTSGISAGGRQNG